MPEQLVSNPGSAYQTVTDYRTGFDADSLVPLAFAGSIRAEYETLLTVSTDSIVLGNVMVFNGNVGTINTPPTLNVAGTSAAITATAGLRVSKTLVGSTQGLLAGIATKAATYSGVNNATQVARSEICIFGPAPALPTTALSLAAGTLYSRDTTVPGTLGTASTIGLNIAQALVASTGAGVLTWVWVAKT